MLLDNAGSGRRGLRAKPSQELFATLYKHYQIDIKDKIIDLGGSSSLNLLVTDNHRQYVIRVYRPYVTEARLKAIQLVRRKLTLHNIPCSKVITTQNGQSWISFAGRLIEVELYIDHDRKMDSWEYLKIGLSVLGKIHSILRDIKIDTDSTKPLFANHIEPIDALPRTLEGIQRIQGWNPTHEEKRIKEAAEELVRLVSSAEQELVKQLPRQLVHGDFWDNNVLFRDKHVVLIADFDFMGERARIDDLALTLYYTLTSMTFLEHGVTNELIGKLRELVDVYDSGLDDPLTTEERVALPLAIVRQPLWSVGGWIALLDDEESARQHTIAIGWKVELALHSIHEIDRWQTAFA